MARLSYGRRSSRTARRESLANQQPRDWAPLPSGYDVDEVRDYRQFVCFTNSIDTARRAFAPLAQARRRRRIARRPRDPRPRLDSRRDATGDQGRGPLVSEKDVG